MEEYENRSSGRRHVKTVGNPAFLCVITAIISICAVIIAIYYINEGVVFVKNTKYGDLTKVYGVSEVIDNVDKNFYPYMGYVPTDEEMATTAMKAITDSLNDKYANYFTAEEYSDYLSSVQSTFKGIGIFIGIEEGVGTRIKKVYAGSPAEKAGLVVGDLIVGVNGIDIKQADLETVSGLISGKEGDAVVLKIQRGTVLTEITAYFGDVHVPTVVSDMLQNDIGYIMITQFSDETDEEFDTALNELQRRNMQSFIIDLRNNPGGYLDTVIKVADKILNEGVIVYIGNTIDDPYLETYSAKEGGLSMPLVVLINENSASASEILAAAIKENHAGTLIGNTTYGKGIVQTTGKLYSTDGYLKFTTSAYYTPDKNDIHGKGVTPDVFSYIDRSKTDYIGTDRLPLNEDTQLLKAIEWLIGQ